MGQSSETLQLCTLHFTVDTCIDRTEEQGETELQLLLTSRLTSWVFDKLECWSYDSNNRHAVIREILVFV